MSEVQSFCYIDLKGRLFEYAFRKQDMEAMRPALEKIRKTSRAFWFGTRMDAPNEAKEYFECLK